VSSIKPKDDGNKLDGAEECAGKFIITGCDSSESFEFTEEAFDEVAFAIEGEVGISLNEPVCFGWNDGSDLAPIKGFD